MSSIIRIIFYISTFDDLCIVYHIEFKNSNMICNGESIEFVVLQLM